MKMNNKCYNKYFWEKYNRKKSKFKQIKELFKKKTN